jgi:hypothetical protein
MNLSRVFVAREIRKYSIKWVTTPVKYVLYIEVLNQWIVVCQKLTEEDMRDTDKKLKALDQEHLDELFFVCEKVGFYDIDPRNLAILKSWEGDKIYIIDTENAQEVTEENHQELRQNMIAQFNLFLKNYLDPYMSPRYARRYSMNASELEKQSPSVLLQHGQQEVNSKKMISMWEGIRQKLTSEKAVTPISTATGKINFEKLSIYDQKASSPIKRFSSMRDIKRVKEAEDMKQAPVDNLLRELKDHSPRSPREIHELPLEVTKSVKEHKALFEMDPNWKLEYD